jgi:Ca-activated chloride channel family protein
MKTHTHLAPVLVIGLLLCLLSAGASGKAIELTAELDRPVILAGQKQTVYLRIGLKGCPAEIFKERAPVNVAVVIDKSGSMAGEKIEKAKEAAILALHRLKHDDIVSVVLYDSDVEVLVPAAKLTDRDDIIRKIRRIEAGGSTALYAGVQTGAGQIREYLSKRYVNRIVLLSDGLANVGPDRPADLGRLGANLIDEGISVTTIGLGRGYNEDLMSQLAYKSDGGHYFAHDADELAGVFDQEFGRALSVVAQKVIIEITCPEGMRPIRLLGREGIIKDRTIMLDMNHIYSDHEKYVLLEAQTPAFDKEIAQRLADVSIRYVDMKDQSEQTLAAPISATVTRSRDAYENALNKRVRADVIEQIAIENNEKALALRDKGQVEAAQSALYDNAEYLRVNAEGLDSAKLDAYAQENTYDAEAVQSDEDWTVQRKVMRENQSVRKTQR